MKAIICKQSGEGGVETFLGTLPENARLRGEAQGIAVYDVRRPSTGPFTAPVLIPGWDAKIIWGDAFLCRQDGKAISAAYVKRALDRNKRGESSDAEDEEDDDEEERETAKEDGHDDEEEADEDDEEEEEEEADEEVEEDDKDEEEDDPEPVQAVMVGKKRVRIK